MAALPQNTKTYPAPEKPGFEEEITRGGFPPPADRPYAKLPQAEQRLIDPARMSELARGGVDGEDAPSGKINE